MGGIPPEPRNNPSSWSGHTQLAWSLLDMHVWTSPPLLNPHGSSAHFFHCFLLVISFSQDIELIFMYRTSASTLLTTCQPSSLRRLITDALCIQPLQPNNLLAVLTCKTAGRTEATLSTSSICRLLKLDRPSALTSPFATSASKAFQVSL
jgi:hypothetical protein